MLAVKLLPRAPHVIDDRLLCPFGATGLARSLRRTPRECRRLLFTLGALEIVKVFETHHGSERLALLLQDDRFTGVAYLIRKFSEMGARFSGRDTFGHPPTMTGQLPSVNRVVRAAS